MRWTDGYSAHKSGELTPATLTADERAACAGPLGEAELLQAVLDRGSRCLPRRASWSE